MCVMKTDFSCGVVPVHVIQGQPHFLLIQHNAGHWAFPKGHPERGESDLDTAARELAEETGIRAVDIIPDPTFDEHYTFTDKKGQPVSKRVCYFVGWVTDPTITLQIDEVSDGAWGTFEESRERITFPEGIELLERVAKYLDEHPHSPLT